MYLFLENNIKPLLDSLRMSSRWLTRLSCLLDSIMSLAKAQNLMLVLNSTFLHVGPPYGLLDDYWSMVERTQDSYCKNSSGRYRRKVIGSPSTDTAEI
jgi:hypothetical protein